MDKYYIFDLDGTIALIDHRRPILDTDDPHRWDKFYQACVKDIPNIAVIEILKSLINNGYKIKIFSGRSESVRKETMEWLDDYVGRFYLNEIEIKMRPDKDYTPDDELKKKWFGELSEEERSNCMGIFDDRQRLVDMWRSLGLVCFQVAPGNF